MKQYLVTISVEDAITSPLAAETASEPAPDSTTQAPPAEIFNDLPPLSEVERRHILDVLEAVNNNHTKAAKILEIDRRTLYRRLERYKLLS